MTKSQPSDSVGSELIETYEAGRPLRSSSTGKHSWAQESTAKVPQSYGTAHCGFPRLAVAPPEQPPGTSKLGGRKNEQPISVSRDARSSAVRWLPDCTARRLRDAACVRAAAPTRRSG